VAKVHVADGSTVVKTMDVTQANTLEVTVGTLYTVRITGLNVVVPKDTTKTLVVKIDPLLQPGDSIKTVYYKVPANGVRGVDGAGLQINEPSLALGDRSFVVKTADKAELEVTASTNNNDKDRNVIVSKTVTTNDVPMLVMSVKSKTNASFIRKIVATTTGSIANSDFVLKLYDGNTLLKTSAGDNGVFDDLSISVGKDSTKELSIKMDVPKQSAVMGTASGTIKVTVSSATIVAEDATDFSTVNVTGAADVKTGNAVFFEKAPSLALANVSITGVKPPNEASNTQWADFKIRINVTAQGGDIYVASNTSKGLLATTSVPASSSIPAGLSLTSDATEQTASKNWLVKGGETKYFEVSGRIENDKAQSYFVRALLEAINWGVTDASPTAVKQTWGLTDFKTSEILLNAKN
jgi:hypothetical protein